jgi:hypothetical protein
LSGKLIPKEAEHHLQTTLCDDFGVTADPDLTGFCVAKPERKLSPKLPLIESLSGNGRRTHVRSRSDASGLVGHLSKYDEISGQFHQHLNQVRQRPDQWLRDYRSSIGRVFMRFFVPKGKINTSRL